MKRADKIDPFYAAERPPEHFERVISVEETKRLLERHRAQVSISVSEGTRRGDGRGNEQVFRNGKWEPVA